jgi:hypothetical protein
MQKLLIRLSTLVGHIIWYPGVNEIRPFNDDIYRAGLGRLKHLDMFDHQTIFRLLV